MKFVNTHRFSPVATKVDMPFETDLFYHDVNDIPDNEKQLKTFLKDNGIVNDKEWWYEQYRRVQEGFIIEDAIVKGGNAIVDGRDAIWNETTKPMEFYNDNFDIPIIIPPETVYLNDVDIFAPQGSLAITGRHYFYLNFFKMYNDDPETGRKDILPPDFTDLDYLKFGRIRLQERWGKDNTELKARQLGYSKSSAGGILGYNYLFVRASNNVIVAGNDEDADELFATAVDGIELVKNTQFYKAFSINSKTKHRLVAKYYKSRITAYTAGSGNDQVLSRLVPYWVVYEEVGKWAKGLVESVRMFVEPSIVTKGRRYGYQTFIGCVCKGTKVYQNDGSKVNIESLEKLNGIIGYSSEGYFKDKVINYNPPQKKQCFRIKTRYGREIECSFDHPFFMTSKNIFYAKREMINGKRKNIKRMKRLIWKEAKDLQVGDYLTLSSLSGMFGNKSMWNPRVVGQLIGDGSYGFNKTPVISNCDAGVLDYIENNFETVVEKEYTTKDNRQYKEIRIKGITKQLRELGIYGQTKSKKRLPIDINKYNENSIKELIGGLYDTDGSVSINILPGGVRSFTINISQLSKELLIEVQSILLKFDINSSLDKVKPDLRDRKIRGTKSFWILRIANSNGLINFAKNIKLTVKYKQDILNYILKNVEYKKALFNFPVEVFSKNKRKVDLVIHSKILYDTIIEIEDIGMQDVYNLTTELSHTYLANDFITHNTGGDMELAADDMEKMHYSTDSDTFLRFKNKFERGATSVEKSGWFSSKAWFSVVDKDGNSDLVKGAKYVLALIEKEKDAVKKHIKITQWALYAQDAFMMSSAGFFGETKINLLNKRLSEIKLHKELQVERHGILQWKNQNKPFDGVEFIETNESESFITITEEPILDANGNVYRSLYEIGIDSYDQDESQTSTSMGALTIRKTFLDNSTTYNTDIALLLERPNTAHGGKNKFYEHCAMAGVWCGNVEMMIEHTKVLIIEWLLNNGFGNLIALRPQMAFAAQLNKSKAMNKYGIDGSMKPNVMAIMSNDLTPEFINNMFITKQIKAFIRYKYSRNYNCDITVSSAHAAVAAKEHEKRVAYSTTDKRNKSTKHHFYYKQTPNGLIQVFA